MFMIVKKSTFKAMRETCLSLSDKVLEQGKVLVNSIRLTDAEIQSKKTRQKWAEGLILQLPENHDGRNSWLLNYGEGHEARMIRENHPRDVEWSIYTNSAKTIKN